MECSSCGAVHSSEVCPESATTATNVLDLSMSDCCSVEITEDNADCEVNSSTDEFSGETGAVSRLIEFPGVSRRSVPPWRRELSERVREVQERRAREAALEAKHSETRNHEQDEVLPPQLELLPHVEVPAVNPLVKAALRRLERAHQRPSQRGSATARTATALAADTRSHSTEETATGADSGIGITSIANSTPASMPKAMGESRTQTVAAVATAPAEESMPASEQETVSERTHKLVVVRAPVVPLPDSSQEKPKPKRLIADDASDPALSYLDSVGAAGSTIAANDDRAPIFSRIIAGVIDLIVLVFLCSPVAAIVELQNGNWHAPRTLGLIGGIAAAVMFLYLTITTALTGKTLGLRILSLRAIDVRTGLIPTGNQAAGRAAIYIISLATGGLGFLFAFAHGEGKAAHDRLSRTAVVRD
jgi:uncharacterized RDD family membrane protein YckC